VTGIAERLAALRAASVSAKVEPTIDDVDISGDWYIHKDIFRAHLELSGRTDVDYLLTRSRDEWAAILQAVERDNQVTMRFL